MANDRTAYPHPDDFTVKRPEYHKTDDNLFEAVINVSPFTVKGMSATKAGARRAAIRNAEKNYKSYNPSYRLSSPYPEKFVDNEGTRWERVGRPRRGELGDYAFTDENGTDYADIDTMLLWDVRVGEDLSENDEDE